MNHASRRAIERLGAKLYGALRHHQRMRDGTLRDTCVYSITAPKRPTVRSHQTWELGKPRRRHRGVRPPELWPALGDRYHLTPAFEPPGHKS